MDKATPKLHFLDADLLATLRGISLDYPQKDKKTVWAGVENLCFQRTPETGKRDQRLLLLFGIN